MDNNLHDAFERLIRDNSWRITPESNRRIDNAIFYCNFLRLEHRISVSLDWELERPLSLSID